MPVLYILAGINHFWHGAGYRAMMPTWLPAHRLLVDISGICELICGCLLLFSKTRKAGAWLTVALLTAVFPANLQMAVNFYKEHNPYLWIAILRLPLQIPLIYWAWLYSKW